MCRWTKGALAVLLLATIPAGAAHGGGGWAVGINFGGPVYYRPYYHYPYYYRPYPVYYVEPAPVVVQAAPVYQVAPAPAFVAPVPTPAQAPAAAPPSIAAATPAPVVQASETRAAEVEREMEQLGSADEKVRSEAAMQLGRMKAKKAVGALTGLLASDRSATVRDAAARALGLIDSPKALDALQRAAQADDDRDVRRSAQFAAEVIRSNMQR
jgi:hypothetical protein